MSLMASNWRKSSRSQQQTGCVEVGRTAEGAAVRDTKNREAGTLAFTRGQWSSFIADLKTGSFDL
ncbi:DUF397 domain-containing protein [Saccharopolyspora shandongensis]|uniref:DUF397 domain-containing protein n=1 Tax=Saccharopolyspora shandongensis TaxID=418495 RepID=UPI0034258393